MKLKIDLDSMSEHELRTLNSEIIRRLQMHSMIRNKSQLMAFRIGDRVAFDADHGTVEGMVTRVNQKTVTIQSDDGRGWRVSPGYVSKIASPAPTGSRQGYLFSVPSTGAERS